MEYYNYLKKSVFELRTSCASCFRNPIVTKSSVDRSNINVKKPSYIIGSIGRNTLKLIFLFLVRYKNLVFATEERKTTLLVLLAHLLYVEREKVIVLKPVKLTERGKG